KVDTGFRKRSCASNKLERDADSKKRHFTLAAEALRSHTHGRAAFLGPGDSWQRSARFWGKAEINQQTARAGSGENDPNRSSPVQCFAYRIWGHRLGFANHSGLMLAARITLAHLAVSDLMTTANSSGELREASRPSCAIRSRMSACTAICTMSVCTLLMTAAGVPAGANSPNQEMASKSGKPDSARVGSSEMIGERLSDVTARPRSLPSRTSGRIAPMFRSVMVTRPPITSVRTAPR